MTEVELKLAFAAQLLKIGKNPNEAFKAALVIFPNDTSLALRAATSWINDPIVLAEKVRLTEDVGEEEFLPSRTDLLTELHTRAKGCTFIDDYTKLMRLYFEVRGMIAKPQPNTNVNIVQNKVMIVRDHGTDENWKEGLRAQQAKLIGSGATC
jgi:hypothetical protein